MPLIELPGFEEAVRRETWTGNVLPMIYEGVQHCPRCTFGEVITLEPFIEEPLFFFGGYGEAQRRTIDVCLACGKASVRVLESIAPIRRIRLG
jgi:hypothetical protein